MAMCLKCGVLENEQYSLTECDSCGRSIHKKVCSGLNASELKVIELKGKRLLKFYCEDCTEGLLCVPKLLKAVSELKTELSLLRNGPTSTPAVQSPTKVTEDLYSELQDRQQRSNNIMLFNIPESGNDLDDVNQLLSDLSDGHIRAEKVSRIGRNNKHGSRSLKVTLSQPIDVSTILASRFKLKGRNVFISPDLTPKQRATERELKEELKRRREAGETDIVLRYVRGIPSIIKKKN